MTDGADSDDISGPMARLEAALERIAVLTASRPAPQQAQPDAASAEVKARLDTMIARIRAAIDEA